MCGRRRRQGRSKAWLGDELNMRRRDHAKARFVCLHHRSFRRCASWRQPAMKDLLDAAIKASGAYPDICFCRPCHNYQRFTRKIDDQQYTYVVAGACGYCTCTAWPNSRARRSLPHFGRRTIPMSYWKIRGRYAWVLRVEIEDDTITPAIFRRSASARIFGNAAARRRFIFNCNSMPTSSCAKPPNDPSHMILLRICQSA